MTVMSQHIVAPRYQSSSAVSHFIHHKSENSDTCLMKAMKDLGFPLGNCPGVSPTTSSCTLRSSPVYVPTITHSLAPEVDILTEAYFESCHCTSIRSNNNNANISNAARARDIDCSETE